MTARITKTLVPIVVLVLSGTLRASDGIPVHPSQIEFSELFYRLPLASQFREVLPNGMVVYVAEDRMFPTFDLSITIRAGSALEPRDKTGLASLVGSQLRDGGTQNLTPAELDERVEFLAASMSANFGETRGRARLSCLAKDVDEALGLFVDMLRYPRFDEERLRLARERVLQNIKRRNDATRTISSIEWGFLMYGEEHFTNRYSSSTSIGNIARDDLFAFHNRYVHPTNMIVAVSGDFDRSAMLDKLAKLFGDWPKGEPGPKTFVTPDYTPKPGVYMLNKSSVNQGRVSIGHRSIVRGSPDEQPLRIMNGILGAAGFQSRLFARVRSDEGLAYNTGSRFNQGVYYREDFVSWFQSKSNSCAYATKIVLEEISRLRDERVSQADVDNAVAYYVESFPQRYPNKMAILRTFVDDEYTGRDPNYWETYLETLAAVTPADVQRVAKAYLHPDKLVILAVGDARTMMAGGHDKAPNLGFDAFGPVKQLSLRDPDTLKH